MRLWRQDDPSLRPDALRDIPELERSAYAEVSATGRTWLVDEMKVRTQIHAWNAELHGEGLRDLMKLQGEDPEEYQLAKASFLHRLLKKHNRATTTTWLMHDPISGEPTKDPAVTSPLLSTFWGDVFSDKEGSWDTLGGLVFLSHGCPEEPPPPR